MDEVCLPALRAVHSEGLVEALAQAGITPVILVPNEGLALINGTQFSTALALARLFDALSTDAIMGFAAYRLRIAG